MMCTDAEGEDDFCGFPLPDQPMAKLAVLAWEPA